MIRVMSAVPRVHLADPEANVNEISALLAEADARGAGGIHIALDDAAVRAGRSRIAQVDAGLLGGMTRARRRKDHG